MHCDAKGFFALNVPFVTATKQSFFVGRLLPRLQYVFHTPYNYGVGSTRRNATGNWVYLGPIEQASSTVATGFALVVRHVPLLRLSIRRVCAARPRTVASRFCAPKAFALVAPPALLRSILSTHHKTICFSRSNAARMFRRPRQLLHLQRSTRIFAAGISSFFVPVAGAKQSACEAQSKLWGQLGHRQLRIPHA